MVHENGLQRNQPVFALSAGPRPSAIKNCQASKFSFQVSKFFFFFMFKNFKDEFRAGKFWNLNAKTDEQGW